MVFLSNKDSERKETAQLCPNINQIVKASYWQSRLEKLVAEL